MADHRRTMRGGRRRHVRRPGPGEVEALCDLEALQAWQIRRVLAWSRLVLTVLAVLLAIVIGRVVQLKLGPDPRLATAAGTAFSSRHELARRGDLLDRRGRVIATTTVGHRLFVDPGLVEDLQTIAVDITAVIGGDPVPIDQAILARADRRYAPVRSLLEEGQVDAVRAAGLRGVGLEPRLVRHYPHGDIAARLIGTVGFEHTGLSGLEHRFDDMLNPRGGRLTYLRDARRRPLWIEPEGYEPGENGRDVMLSIDLVVQAIVEERLQRAVREFNAGGGRVVVLDCVSGEILAMHDVVNERPGWDEQTEDPARRIDPALGRSRCVTDPYEPGSTFKPFAWAVATALGKATLDEVIPTPESVGYRTPYGRLIRDAHYYGPSTWRYVLVKSMNSGMAIVAARMTHAELRDTVWRFGFGERTSCNLPGESAGIVTRPDAWSAYTQSSVAMGHEIAVTPVQMVRAFSAFARDGTIPSLHLVARRSEDHPYQFVRRAIPESIARLTRSVLRDVMWEGTGRLARSDRYTMFGKSGTAQLPRKEGGGYHEDRYVSSFVAGAPFAHPRLVVLCVIDDPDKARGHYGGEIAGPVVRDLVDATLDYLGVPADKEQVGPAVPAG